MKIATGSHGLVRLAVAASLGICCHGATAGGFALIEQNASGLGNAYAGQAAAAENASTVFFNPAGMTLVPGRQVSGTLNIIRPNTQFTDNGGSRSPANAAAPAGGSNGNDAGGWNYVPNAFMSWQFSDRLWAGIGLTVPFGLKTNYDPTFIGRFQSQKSQLQTYDINPSVAFKVNDWLSLGGGISYQYARLGLDRSFFAGATRAQTVSLHDGAWGWNAGAMLNLGKDTRVGLTYRSTINYDLAGGITVAAIGTATGKVSLSMPDSVSLAISHQLNEKWQLLGDATWTHWSRIQNLPLFLTSPLGTSPAGAVSDTLDLQFRDGYRFGVGANYRWTDNFMLKLGVAYDRSPVPDATHRSVFLPDADRVWLSFGGKHQLTKNGVLDVGYARLFLSDADVLRNKGVGAAGAQGIVSGSYKAKVDIVSLQYTHSF